MGVLAWTPPKSTLGALTPPQELADAVERGSVSPVSPRRGDTSPPSLVNPPRGRSRGCHPPISVVTRKPPEEWAALIVAGRQSLPLLWGQQEVAPPQSRGWPAATVAMVGSPSSPHSLRGHRLGNGLIQQLQAVQDPVAEPGAAGIQTLQGQRGQSGNGTGHDRSRQE